VKRCEKLKKEIVQEWSHGNDVKYLDSIPGITPFLAATILAELLPLERFQRINQIIAFAGLDPSVKQTGGKRGTHGPISKRGSPTLREALFLAAFGSFSKCHSLRLGAEDPAHRRRASQEAPRVRSGATLDRDITGPQPSRAHTSSPPF